MTEPKKIMYGEMAAQVTVTLPDGSQHQQWFCRKCRKIWGANDEHMASCCCCTHKLCECGQEHVKHWTMCDDCREKQSSATWYAKPEVEWDGEWPLALADGDNFFFSEDALIDYIQETYEEGASLDSVASSLRLTSCKPNRPRSFNVTDWLCDDLPEDGEVSDAESIDERINEILSEIGIVSYSAEFVRLNVRKILTEIGYWDTE